MSDDATAPMSAVHARLQEALGNGYQVERELGAGGFAVVFLVRDVALKRRLAVKVLLPDMVETPTAMERFRREAETIAQLSHPNIVPLHFTGQKGDLVYIAMGFVDGGSLHDRIENAAEPMPFDAISRAISEVASALAHAHKHGVIHRDIKPHNVLIDSESGRCLVTDFGIARTEEGTQLTATGMLIGTPAYISPEQITGEPADHRVDIYALGVMAYELVSGKQPFDGPTPAAVVMRRLEGPPPPLTGVRRNVPASLVSVIDKCLAMDPAHRFLHSGEIVNALAAAASVSSESTIRIETGAHRAPKSQPRRAAWIAATIGVLALAGVVGKSLVSGSTDATTTTPPVTSSPSIDAGMVLIPAGEYVIGGGSGRSAPVHRVQLPAFAIDAHEVTVGAYAAYATAAGMGVPWVGAVPDSLVPVTRVTWTEAQTYCSKRHPSGGSLPTEEQWEAAARGREGRVYPWGNTFIASAANIEPGGAGRVARAGAYSSGATPEGVVDLIGNVWEWTTSPVRAYPNGQPLPDSLAAFRIIRGGDHRINGAETPSWFRGGYGGLTAPRDHLTTIGFRCVMTPR